MACGVPVVQPRRGAFTEIVTRTGGGLLVDPDDADALAEGLATIWRDPPSSARLSQAAWDGVREHHAIERSAQETLQAYELALGASMPASSMAH
jgi:glycosyltransferase involved in cell wall biosynthesis